MLISKINMKNQAKYLQKLRVFTSSSNIQKQFEHLRSMPLLEIIIQLGGSVSTNFCV